MSGKHKSVELSCSWALQQALFIVFITGKVFTLVAVVESISTLAATSLYNTVYRATLDLYDGFCFLMGAGLIGLCIFVSV